MSSEEAPNSSRRHSIIQNLFSKLPHPHEKTSFPEKVSDTVLDEKDAIQTTAPPPESLTKQTEDKSQFFQNLTFYVRDFPDSIESHGLAYLFEEGRDSAERIFWTVVHISSLVTFITLTIYVYNFYLEVPVLLSFATKSTPSFEVPFPAVSVCSQAKTIQGVPTFAEVHKKYHQKKMFSNKEELKLYEYYHVTCENTLYMQTEAVKHKSTLGALDNSLFNTLKKLSPEVNDIIMECSFLGKIENCSNLFKPIYTDVGLCYSFNLVEWKEIFSKNAVQHPGFFEAEISGSDWSSQQEYKDSGKVNTYPRRGYLPGVRNSLMIKLGQAKRDVDPVCSGGIEGFKIVIHNPLQVPDFTHYHFQVALNTAVVGLIEPVLVRTSKEVSRLSLKKRKCYLSKERTLKFFQKYSRRNCLVECYANWTLDLCNCVPFFMPRDNETEICGAHELKCIADAKQHFLTSTLQEQRNKKEAVSSIECNCKPSCNTLRYNIDMSQSDWDAKTFALSKNSSYEVSQFNLYFKMNHFLMRKRIEVYGIAELMASIGGLLLLFMGASLVTLAEIIYTFTIKFLHNKIVFGSWAGFDAVQRKLND